jgi:hypothetical protein
MLSLSIVCRENSYYIRSKTHLDLAIATAIDTDPIDLDLHLYLLRQVGKSRSAVGRDRYDYFSNLNYDCDATIATMIPMPIIQIN